MKLNVYRLLAMGLMSSLSMGAQTDLCIDNFSNPFRSESFVQHSNGLITGVYSAAGLEAGELAQPVPPSNDQIGEPVLFLGRTFENQNQNNLGGVQGGKRQAKFTRNSPNGNVSMTIWAGKLNSFNSLFGNGTVVMHYGNATNPLDLDLSSMSNPAFVLRNCTATLAPGNSVLVKITVTSSIGTAQHKTRTVTHSMVAAGDQTIPVSNPDFSGIDWSDVDRISLSLINSGSGGNQWDIQGFCVRASSNPTPKMGTALAQNVRLYPVPASDRLHVEWTGTSNQTVALRILDLQGRVVAVQTERAEGEMHTFDLDVAPLANGVYTLVVQANGTTEARRFSVEH